MEEIKKILSIESWYRDIIIKAYKLAHIPENERTPEMCFVAIHYWGAALEYVPEKFKTYELCLDAVRHNTPVDEGCSALAFVPEKFKTYELCLEAIRHDYLTSIFWDQDQDGGFNTVEFYSAAINYVPEDFKTPELCFEALIHNPSSMPGLLNFVEPVFDNGPLTAIFVKPEIISDILKSYELFVKTLKRIGMPIKYNEDALKYFEKMKIATTSPNKQ